MLAIEVIGNCILLDPRQEYDPKLCDFLFVYPEAVAIHLKR